MFPQDLTVNEIRVIGCLMEKAIVTPDVYPMTLNALTNACNQKSSRDPVLSLSQGVVQHTVRELETKRLVRVEENFKRGVEKYTQRFCNTSFSELKFDAPQYAIICLLLLRGPQTPGELRAHSARLHSFADNREVEQALDSLIQRDGDALVVKLPRAPGRKDSEYMHLFSGPIDMDEYVQAAQAPRESGGRRGSLSELEHRVSDLEQELADLKKLLSS